MPLLLPKKEQTYALCTLASYTKKKVEEEGRRCLLASGDVGDEEFCFDVVENTIKEFNKLDILVNNAGEIYLTESIEDVTKDRLKKTFDTNVFSMFYMTKAAVKHLKSGSSIINTASVTATAYWITVQVKAL